MMVAGIRGGGRDICTQVLEHAAALERSSTQNRAALMRSSCDRKNCRLMGFWKTHRIHGTGIFVPTNLGKYTTDAMGDDFSSYAGWRCPGEIARCTYYWNY